MTLDLERIDAIFFDLDDTLIDTSGVLVDPALRVTARRLLDAGMPGAIAEVEQFLLRQAQAGRGLDYFRNAAVHFGASDMDVDRLAEIGRRTFLTVEVPAIRTLPGVAQLLDTLEGRCRLFLVTAGDPATQRAKIAQLDIGSRFDEMRFVSSLEGEDKDAAFVDLMQGHDLEAERCVCVGDRLVGEIRSGNHLGMRTVWLRRGEFSRMAPATPMDTPDFTISDPRELGTLLGLASTPARRVAATEATSWSE